MNSILDQYIDEKLDTIQEEPIVQSIKEKKPRRVKLVNDDNNNEIEEKREQLSILAVLGTIDQYTGIQMSLSDVKKLVQKDVDKYYNRYQVTITNKVTSSLVDSGIDAVVTLISYGLSIDNSTELTNDLKNNEMLRTELNNIAGYVILKGGRFVALASCLIQVAKHVKISNNDDDTWTAPPITHSLEEDIKQIADNN